jgi:hypothetical protein
VPAAAIIGNDEVAERVAHRERLLDPRSASWVRPSATSARIRGANACTVPNLSPSWRKLVSARRDSSSASTNSRRPQAGSTRSASPSSPAPRDRRVPANRGAPRPPTPRPPRTAVGRSARRPADPPPSPTEPVAEQVELLRRGEQSALGQLGVARQERHPRLVLANPGRPRDRSSCSRQASASPSSHSASLSDPPNTSASPRSRSDDRELDVVAELAEDLDARAEFGARRREITVALVQDAEQPPRDASWRRSPAAIDASSASSASARAGRRSPVARPAPGPAAATAPRARWPSSTPEVERPRGVAARLVERADVDRSLGRLAQQCDRLLGDVVARPGTDPISATSSARTPRGGRSGRSGSSALRSSPTRYPHGVGPGPAWSASDTPPRERRRCGTASSARPTR